MASAIVLFLFIAGGIVGTPWYHLISIDGSSMEPTIHRGDLIVVAPPPGRIEPETVVVLATDDGLVTHRVVSLGGDGSIVTKGDANRVPDSSSTTPRVVGIYVATVPLLGDLLRLPRSSAALFADSVTATTTIHVTTWETPPTPTECEDVAFAEIIVGGPGDDRLNAGNGGALVLGLGGDDVIEGGNGKDCLVGGDGNDTLSGGNGRDVLLGGEGDDRLAGGDEDDSIGGGNGKDRLDGGPGTDDCDGGLGSDTLFACESSAALRTAPTTAPSASTPRPSPTPAPTGSPTATPEATSASSPSPAPTLGASPGASPAATPDVPAPAPPTPEVTPTPEPLATPTGPPAATPGPAGPPEPSATPDATSRS